MPLSLRLNHFSSLSHPHGLFFSSPYSWRNPILPSPIRRLREARENLSMPRVSLPLPHSPHSPPHRCLHCSLRQVSPLLSRALSRSPNLQALLPPHLTSSHFIQNSLFFSQSRVDPVLASSSASRSRSISQKIESGMNDCNSGPNNAEVDQVCKIVENLSNLNRNMEDVLTECGVIPTQSLVVSVLDRYRHTHKPAYRFFIWAGSTPCFTHDIVTYNKMLQVFANTRQFETMVEFLEEMGKFGFLSIECLKIAIQSFASAREMKKCLWVFQLMKKFGFGTGSETFNYLLDQLAKVKLGKVAHNLLDKMKAEYKPDLRTYTILLYGWCKVKNLVEAGRVWNEMFDNGFEPDIVAYNIMIEGLILGQRRNEAMKLFEFMKAKGPNPNLCTYSSIIHDLCKGGKMNLAVSVFKEMQESGYKSNLAMYTCLLTGFGNIKKIDEVLILLDEMNDTGLRPDLQIYNSLIKLMIRRNMPEEANRIYKMMVNKGVEPTIHTYNMLMKSYFSKNYEMGCEIWYDMKNKDFCPDINSYAIFIKGHIRHGKVEEAERYILEMITKGMKMPQIDYYKFAADFSKAGKPYKLHELAQKMSFEGNLEAFNVLKCWDDGIKTRLRKKDLKSNF